MNQSAPVVSASLGFGVRCQGVVCARFGVKCLTAAPTRTCSRPARLSLPRSPDARADRITHAHAVRRADPRADQHALRGTDLRSPDPGPDNLPNRLTLACAHSASNRQPYRLAHHRAHPVPHHRPRLLPRAGREPR